MCLCLIIIMFEVIKVYRNGFCALHLVNWSDQESYLLYYELLVWLKLEITQAPTHSNSRVYIMLNYSSIGTWSVWVPLIVWDLRKFLRSNKLRTECLVDTNQLAYSWCECALRSHSNLKYCPMKFLLLVNFRVRSKGNLN